MKVEETALVVVDMQRFFFVENKEVDQENLAANCSEIVEVTRKAGMPVINVVTLYREDETDWPSAWRGGDESWCANLVKGRELSNVVGGLVAEPEDYYVEKKRFSAFYNTNLDDILRALGCSGIYLIGYSADVCIRFTAVDAYNRGYSVGLIREGIESFRETKEMSVEYLGWTIGAKCVALDEYRRLLA